MQPDKIVGLIFLFIALLCVIMRYIVLHIQKTRCPNKRTMRCKRRDTCGFCYYGNNQGINGHLK
jgi:hypothetical protein